MSEYPKMLYRCAKPGTGIDVCEKHHVTTQIVDSEEAELQALDEGWRANPAPPPPEKPNKAA